MKPYQWQISKLIYLSFGTRSNIAFAMSQLSKHNLDLRSNHMKVAKKVVRYLKGIIHLELVYRLSQSNVLAIYSFFGVIRYRDINYVNNS